MDFAGVLRLGQLSMDGVRVFCAFDDRKDVTGDATVGPVGGNGAGADGAGWPVAGGVEDGDGPDGI